MGRKRTCDQEAVLDAFARNLTLKEISRLLRGVAIGTLGVILHRARKAGDPRAGLAGPQPGRRRPMSRSLSSRRRPPRDVAGASGARISVKRSRARRRRRPHERVVAPPASRALRPGAGGRAGCGSDQQHSKREDRR